MNTGTKHDWKKIKGKIKLALKQGKCEPTTQSVADYLGMSRTTLKDGMWREWGWKPKDLENLYRPPEQSIKQKKEYPPVLLKAAVFDIEVTDFKAESTIDVLTCCSILPLEGDVYSVFLEYEDLDKTPRDLRVLKDTLDALAEYDILIGHNIAAFDFNWLFTRAIIHDLAMPKRWMYYDTYSAAKRIAIKGTKSLDNLCSALRIGGVKTKINRPSWLEALSPSEQEFNACLFGTQEKDYADGIIFHCEEDVKANKKLFDALWPRDRKLVNLPFTRKW
jgi:hypothetical protein